MDIETLKLRQEALGELLELDSLAANVEQCLTQLPGNLEKLCSNLAIETTASKDVGQKYILNRYSSLMELKQSQDLACTNTM